MTNVDLLASYWTIAGGAYPHTDHEYSKFEFRSRVEAIAKAGFKGMGIWHADLEHTLEKLTLKEMKKILDDNGLEHIELEFLVDWFMEGERKRQSDVRKRLLLDAAQAFGARHIKVGDFFNEPCPMPKLIESFAALCKDAADAGTRVVYELMPFANVNTLEGVLTLVEGANAPNGGIIFDLWHVVKLKLPYDVIARVPPRYFLGIELNDGNPDTPAEHDETVNHRQFCGDGGFDVKGFVSTMLKAGYRGPWGIEVLNAKWREAPLEELTARAYSTTIAQFPR